MCSETRNGHIDEMKLSLPATDWPWATGGGSLSRISFSVFFLLVGTKIGLGC
jgi:hypothetical protein